MIFTGKNLLMVKRGIALALDEIHNQIATCPDVIRYEDDIVELEAEKARFERLLARVDRALVKGARS